MRFSILCFLILTGCETFNPVVISPAAIEESPVSGEKLEKAKQTVVIDDYLLQPCGKLEDLLIDNPTPYNILMIHKSDVIRYKECSEKHDAVVDLLRKAFNLQQPGSVQGQ
jgi:hypothetical protein